MAGQLQRLVRQPVALGYATKPGHFSRRTIQREIVGRLEIEPELRSGVQRLREKPCCFWSDATLAAHELVDPLKRDAEVLGQGDLSLTERPKELLAKNFAGVCGNALTGMHGYPL